jgi:hypothetical protein
MPDALFSKVEVVNWSLVELGQAPAYSIDTATALGAIVDTMWPRAVARCFGLHDWTFCRRTHLLTRQAATPVTGYAYGFDLPGGRIGEPMRYLRDPRTRAVVRDVRIEAGTVFSDEPVLYAVCRMAVDPEQWDAQFADCFASALAGFLAVPLLQDSDLADEKLQLAFGPPSQGGSGGAFGRLIAQIRSAEPQGAEMLAADPLTAGRGAGPWYGRG